MGFFPSKLDLGWKLDENGFPNYWIQKGARAGNQRPSDVERVPSDLIGSHCVIVAQSGSGKSFFLGRLLEEVLTKTIADCLVLDPNSDFRRLVDYQPAEEWRKARFDRNTMSGRLHTEKSREAFVRRWRRVSIQIKTQRIPYTVKPSGEYESDERYEDLSIWWPSVSSDILSEDSSPTMRTEMYHCHSFVSTVVQLEQLGRPHRHLYGHRLMILAKEIYDKIKPLVESPSYEDAARGIIAPYFQPRSPAEREAEDRRLRRYMNTLTNRLLAEAQYFGAETASFYFGNVSKYQEEGFLADSPPTGLRSRVEVLDLPSLPDRKTQFLAVYSRVALAWDSAREKWYESMRPESVVKRVPTFILLDEAHNLIPAETREKSELTLRELFRTIAAEGRKYDVFLILATQRPDKLDQFVISECENKAIMKLDSRRVASEVRKSLGLDDLPDALIDQCTKFGIGKVLLSGRWTAGNPRIIYTAARRTKEGGSRILPKDWAFRPRTA